MEYLIRDFCEDDLDALVSLCASHAAYERSSYDSNNKKIRLKQALLSPKPSLYCWIVTVNDQVVGYATYTFDFSTWDAGRFLHLDCLYLEENIRGFGVGEEILQRIIALAKEENCVAVQWQTPSFNEKAIRFYSRLNGRMTDKKRFVITLAS
jgi:GNAT superfamily N-acetyltransferase